MSMHVSRSGSRLAAAAGVLAAGLLLAACGGGSDSGSGGGSGGSSGSTQAAQKAGGQTVQTGDTEYGEVLVDSKGMTLYALEKDSKDTSTCTGGCATAWPPLVVTGKVVVAKGLDADDFATFMRTDNGMTQVSVYGAPLYTFSGDKAPGDTNGKTIPNWYVVGANGKPMESAAAATTAPTTSNAGY